MTDSIYSEIDGIVHISTTLSTGCKHCHTTIGGDRFEESVNHYIHEHDYKLLHVGQEASHADGGLWYSTVAVLGL
jgi:hypothetical protein